MPSEGMGGTEEDFTSWKHGSCQGQLVAVKNVLEMGGRILWKLVWREEQCCFSLSAQPTDHSPNAGPQVFLHHSHVSPFIYYPFFPLLRQILYYTVPTHDISNYQALNAKQIPSISFTAVLLSPITPLNK